MQIKGAFIWDQSRIRIIGIMRVSVRLAALLNPEFLDFHSGYSAPRSRLTGSYIPIPEYPKRTRPKASESKPRRYSFENFETCTDVYNVQRQVSYVCCKFDSIPVKKGRKRWMLIEMKRLILGAYTLPPPPPLLKIASNLFFARFRERVFVD